MRTTLSGITVLDLSRLLPGAYCTQLLQQLGAEVIKVETPRLGDYARLAPETFGGARLFEVTNRHKKSVALNYRNPRGRQVFRKLLAGADVVLEAFRPGLAKRYGLDAETVRGMHPRIVYCSLSGYGQSGPYRDRAGHDLNYIALGGLLDLNGAAGGPPVPPGVQIADLSGAMLAAIAILAALVGRESTGQGATLDISMLDAVLSWVGPIAGPLFLARGESPRRGRMPLSGGLACFNVYATADGEYLTLAALEPPLWTTFCKAVDRPDWIKRQWDSDLTGELGALFLEKSRADWLAHFEGLEVCLEPVQDYAGVLSHPQVRHRGLLIGMEGDSPFQFVPEEEVTGAPALGAHTREVLSEAGFSSQEIAALAEDGVIGLPDG